MQAELYVLVPMTLLFWILAYLIAVKQKINLIHDYHTSKVRVQDRPAYCIEIGKALFGMGLGMFLTAAIDVWTASAKGWIAFVFFFVLGMIIFIRAQLRFNGSVF